MVGGHHDVRNCLKGCSIRKLRTAEFLSCFLSVESQLFRQTFSDKQLLTDEACPAAGEAGLQEGPGERG